MKTAWRMSRFIGFVLVTALIGPALVVAGPITVSNAPLSGQLPVMISAFVNASGDVLPAGQTDYYVFTLFDTGATRVFVDTGTAATLGVVNGMVTDVRINGLGAIDANSLNAPIGPGQAQAEVADVPVRVPGADITLIGGPVTNNVQALIDYTSPVTRGPYPFLGGASVTGPDMTFYSAAGVPPFTTAIELALQPYGTISASDPGLGQRYRMYGVAFNEGASSVASPSSGDLSAVGIRFLYDTGTNVTIIRDPLAAALGLTYAPEFTFEVGGLGMLSGYYLDSITMAGAGGTYTVLNAPVLVTSDPLGGGTDAIIGSNLFWSSRILFDGPGHTLGIEGEEGVPVPEPSTLILLGLGLAGLRARSMRRP